MKRLKRQNTATIIAFVGLFALLLATNLIRPKSVDAQTTPTFSKISVQRLDLVNPSGRLVGFISAESGGAGLVFEHPNKKVGVTLGIAQDGAIFALQSADTNVHVISKASNSNAPRNVSGVAVGDQRTKMVWAVRHDPTGIMELMKDSTGSVKTASNVSSQGEFRYHVQKSALDQVGEMLNWYGAVKSLLQ